MKEKIYQVCEEMLKNEEEAKKFASYESLDELYEYFLSKLPGLTKDEFEEFICEALDNYAKEKENVNKIGEGDLGGVSGGAFDLKTKLTAGALAFMAAMSAIPGMNAANVDNVGEAQSISQTKSVKTKISDTFGRVKSWVKEHPGLTTGIALGTAVLVGTGIFLGVRHSRKAKDSNVGGVAKPTDNKENKESEKRVDEDIRKSNPAEEDKKHEDAKSPLEKQVLAFEEKCNKVINACKVLAEQTPTEKEFVKYKVSLAKSKGDIQGLFSEVDELQKNPGIAGLGKEKRLEIRNQLMEFRKRLVTVEKSINTREKTVKAGKEETKAMEEGLGGLGAGGKLSVKKFSGGFDPNALDDVDFGDDDLGASETAGLGNDEKDPFAGIDDL